MTYSLKSIVFLLSTIFIINLSVFNYLSSYAIAHTPAANYRDLMIILDYDHQESIIATLNADYKEGIQPSPPQGIGAITGSTIVAIDSEACPILISKSLIHNIVYHSQVFKDFIQLEHKTLSKNYSHFNRFKKTNSLQNFRQHCIYAQSMHDQVNKKLKHYLTKNNIEQAVYKISTDIQFCDHKAPCTIQHPHEYIEKRTSHLEVVTYFLAHYCAEKLLTQWTIKDVNDDLYLCIPHKYLEHNTLNLMPSTINYYLADQRFAQLTDTELKLGLKVNHFKNAVLPQDFLYCSTQSQGIKRKSRKITALLKKLFITHKDYSQNNILQNNSKIYSWIIYMDGHGLYSYSPKKELRRFEKMRKHYKALVTHKRYNTSGTYYDNYQYNKRTLAEIEESITTLNKYIKAHKNPFEGTIVSLPISEFKSVLNFFNTDIITSLLYYSSCYAGGEHLVTPFLTTTEAPLLLNYTVITGTLTDNTALQEIPYIALPPYRECQMSYFTLDHTDFIDLKNKNLKISTSLDFEKFFEAAHNDHHRIPSKYTELASSINHYISKEKSFDRECIGNIPSLRKPFGTEFNIIQGDEKWISLKNSDLSYAIKSDNDAVLLYTPTIQKITFKRTESLTKSSSEFTEPASQSLSHQLMPIISLVHGEAAHKFEMIEAPDYSLSDIVNAFSSLPSLSASKSFLIKELIIKSDNSLENIGIYSTNKHNTLVLKDVLIMHKVHDINNIKLMSECLSIVAPAPHEFITGIYFTTQENNHYSLKWEGQQLDQNSLEISHLSQNKHKNNLLAYHTELQTLPLAG